MGAKALLYADRRSGQQRVPPESQEMIRTIALELLCGRPLGELDSWQGPVVMNTREELLIAFVEFHKGTFVKHS